MEPDKKNMEKVRFSEVVDIYCFENTKEDTKSRDGSEWVLGSCRPDIDADRTTSTYSIY